MNNDVSRCPAVHQRLTFTLHSSTFATLKQVSHSGNALLSSLSSTHFCNNRMYQGNVWENNVGQPHTIYSHFLLCYTPVDI